MEVKITDNNLAFVFPGQGSQAVGMLAGLAESHPEVEATFGSASEVLGYDLWDLVRHGPAERLNQTVHTQPAMLAAGVAAWRVWCGQTQARPGWLAGHSLGEYTALVCAGAMDFQAAVLLVAERARLMQEAVPADVGAMAAILGLDDAEVVEVCARASGDGEIVTAANFNDPKQIVIAGHKAAVMRAVDLAKEAGAKRAVVLPVSVPSHCPLMQAAAERFAATLETTAIVPPTLAVVHNVDVATHPEPAAIRAALARQLHGAVRWADSIRHMSQQGVDRFVECGPGKVLAGLNKRIVPEAKTENLFDPASLAKALELAP